MVKCEKIGKELSNILENVMDQYWDRLNSALDVPDEEFEKLCNLGCDLARELADYQNKILNAC